jgi:ABC-type amino acid transport substrate-binding protein
MKRIILIVLTLVIALVVVGCTGETSTTTKETLIVGMEAGYAPFNWTVDEQGAFSEAVAISGQNAFVDGYDVSIAKIIAEELDMDLVIKAVEWDGLILSLVESQEIDLIIAGMSPTADRALTVDFTDEYYQSTHVVVLKSDSVFANATSINDFSGARAVGQIQTIYDDLIVQLAGAVHENPLSDVPTIITAINQGTYDLTILELPVAMAVVETNPALTYIEFDENNGFDISYEDSAVAIALRKGESELLLAINQILATISSEERENLMADAITRQP